jgi:hypothetical protein
VELLKTHGLELIVSDSHKGFKAARKALFPRTPWRRCQFHLQQNAGQFVPKMAMRSPVAADIRAIFNAPDQDERLLGKFLTRYDKTAPQLASVLASRGSLVKTSVAKLLHGVPGKVVVNITPQLHTPATAVVKSCPPTLRVGFTPPGQSLRFNEPADFCRKLFKTWLAAKEAAAVVSKPVVAIRPTRAEAKSCHRRKIRDIQLRNRNTLAP